MEKLKDEPFALIGVNILRKKPEALKAVMTKEKLHWRSFADEKGEISRSWCRPATPAFYLIDQKGIIRRQWIGSSGGKAMHAAIAELIEGTEGTRR